MCILYENTMPLLYKGLEHAQILVWVLCVCVSACACMSVHSGTPKDTRA